MSFGSVNNIFDWYSEDEIFNPSGAGAKIYSELVDKKIGRTLKLEKGVSVKTGVLVSDPTSAATQLPVAIICVFQDPITVETLSLTHKLAWNFCRSPLLITIDPEQVRVLSCYVKPEESEESGSLKKQTNDLFSQSSSTKKTISAEILEFPINKSHASHQIAESLHWLELFSGQFFRNHSEKFPINQRVDYLLLDNLRYIRSELHDDLGLDVDIVHDLLARIIFIQFLFQRKDSKGVPAIDTKFLRDRKEDNTLSKEYKDLEEILLNKTDTYKFFKWLNNKFNGDLFPGRGETADEREYEWKQEMEKVKPIHLERLSRFISGREELSNGQISFWERYAFDVIPLEFISSIYEVFVEKNKGVHYTPSYLVDYILDNHNVLPWNGTDWDLKILDPACGSGIFLVKTFQRLVQRWKNANPSKRPDEKFLVGLLANNLFGVDINGQAVRVAAFSLYLAMCDEIDPRHYWQDWEFPPMRDKQIVKRDFFEENPLFPHKTEQIQYDLVIGNAPWAKGSAKDSMHARKWAKAEGWKIPYEDIGPLFLAKAAEIVKTGRAVVMIQPTGSLLINQSSNCVEFRHKLFTKYKISEVVNLSLLRFGLFSDSVSPSCVITLLSTLPNENLIKYVCPRITYTGESENLLLESSKVKYIDQLESLNNPSIWLTYVFGSDRDLTLIEKLKRMPSIQDFIDGGVIGEKDKRRGTIRGRSKQVKQEIILGRRILNEKVLPPDSFLHLSLDKLNVNTNPWTHYRDSTNYDAFQAPQLIVKLSWQIKENRFRAVLVNSDDGLGALCSDSYVSIHTSQENINILEAACLSFNSKLAVYYLFLTSRASGYRPHIDVSNTLSLPIPRPEKNILEKVNNFEDVDNQIYKLFKLKASEIILVEDFYDYVLSEIKDKSNSIGRKRTDRNTELELVKYCKTFQRVVEAGFGVDTNVSVTIFQEDSRIDLSPVRIIKVDLDVSEINEVKIEKTSYALLWKRLKKFHEVFNQNIHKYYEPSLEGVGISVYLIKPDQKRYWLESVALEDADEICAEISQTIYISHLNSRKISKEKKIA